MVKYYESKQATLYLGDCRHMAFGLLDVDAVITDPPYGIAYRNRRGDHRPRAGGYAQQIDGDEDQSVGQSVLDMLRDCGFPVCSFAHHRQPWLGDWRQWLVWDKGETVGGGGDRRTCWKFTWELIQVAGFGALNGSRHGSVLRFPTRPDLMTEHPTQKPIDLMAYLIGKLTKAGAIVLDPFAGSGTTGVAAIQTGRRFLGVEVNERYAETAARRLEKALESAAA